MDQPIKTLASEPVNAPKWMGRIIIAVILGEAIWNLIVSVMNNLVVPWLGDVMGPSPGVPTSFTQRPYNYPDLFVSVFELCVAGLVAAVLNYFALRPGRGRVQKVKSVPTAGAEPGRLFPRAEVSPAPPAINSSNAVLSPEISIADHPTRAISTPAPVAPVVPLREEPVVVYQPVAVAPPAPAPAPLPVASAPPASAPVPSTVAVVPPAPVVPPPVAAKPPAPPPKKEPSKPKKPKEVYYNIVGEPMPSDDD